MRKVIHINQIKIKSNNKTGDRDPVITVKSYKEGRKTHHENNYASEVDILDKDGNIVASVVYRPDDPLPCGAKVWIETNNEVILK